MSGRARALTGRAARLRRRDRDRHLALDDRADRRRRERQRASSELPTSGSISSLFDAGSDDPGDSILAAEVAAARGLLRELDPRNTRVALITFAGELEPVPSRFGFPRTATPPAVTREPLTREFRRIERSLDELLKTKPSGVTHMAAGVDQATRELLGQPGARSQADPNSEKVVLFLTDGQPTLPYGPGKDADERAAPCWRRPSARTQAGIRVHSFAIGPEALAGPVATVELAARTQRLLHPGARARRSGRRGRGGALPGSARRGGAERDHRRARASVPHRRRAATSPVWCRRRPALNRIEIVARADDGTTIRREIEVNLDPAAPPVADSRGAEGPTQRVARGVSGRAARPADAGGARAGRTRAPAS